MLPFPAASRGVLAQSGNVRDLRCFVFGVVTKQAAVQAVRSSYGALTCQLPAFLRDDARTVLVAMARELGPNYLPFICEVLAASLPARGYTAHVLGHTVHAVVEGMHKVRVLALLFAPPTPFNSNPEP